MKRNFNLVEVKDCKDNLMVENKPFYVTKYGDKFFYIKDTNDCIIKESNNELYLVNIDYILTSYEDMEDIADETYDNILLGYSNPEDQANGYFDSNIYQITLELYKVGNCLITIKITDNSLDYNIYPIEDKDDIIAYEIDNVIYPPIEELVDKAIEDTYAYIRVKRDYSGNNGNRVLYDAYDKFAANEMLLICNMKNLDEEHINNEIDIAEELLADLKINHNIEVTDCHLTKGSWSGLKIRIEFELAYNGSYVDEVFKYDIHPLNTYSEMNVISTIYNDLIEYVNEDVIPDLEN